MPRATGFLGGGAFCPGWLKKVLWRKWLVKIFQNKWKSAGEGEAAKRRGRAGMFMKA